MSVDHHTRGPVSHSLFGSGLRLSPLYTYVVTAVQIELMPLTTTH